MKFTCIKENLERAVAMAERFVGKSLNLPILSTILLESEDGWLTVSATNLEFAVKINVAGKGQRKGRAAVPAKTLSPLIQSIKDEKIDLEEKQGNIFIKSSTREIRINGMAADDFPLIPKVKKTHSFEADGFGLAKGLEKVLPAVSSSDFKPELNGVYWKLSGTQLNLVATDTFRLAEKTITLGGKKEGGNFSFILPQRASQEVARIFGEAEEVTVSYGENQTVFETDEIKVVSRLVDGNFPEYGGIIPKNFDVTAFINRRELLDAVRASSIFTSKLQDVSLKLAPKELQVSSANQEVGEYKTSLPVKATGEEVSLSFNYRYFLDGLNSLEEDEIFMGLNSEQKPSILKNKEDNSYVYVIMPIRVH